MGSEPCGILESRQEGREDASQVRAKLVGISYTVERDPRREESKVEREGKKQRT